MNILGLISQLIGIKTLRLTDGLPNLFAHKIRTVLSNSNGIIDYDTLTYGDIIYGTDFTLIDVVTKESYFCLKEFDFWR